MKIDTAHSILSAAVPTVRKVRPLFPQARRRGHQAEEATMDDRIARRTRIDSIPGTALDDLLAHGTRPWGGEPVSVPIVVTVVLWTVAVANLGFGTNTRGNDGGCRGIFVRPCIPDI